MFKRFVSLFTPTEIPVDMLDKDEVKLYIRYAFIYSVIMGVISFIITLMGCALVIGGITDATHWSVSFLDMTISDAGPGTVLFFVGLLLVQITRFDRCVSMNKAVVPGPNKDKTTSRFGDMIENAARASGKDKPAA